ncbi:hypothetical protein PI124_g13963 [Phytophthora idaei]|nr:hypothetical protein PI125_g23476 [Phytophthora idaei]KAG3141661.1 hypothetical protein PI126_g15404 [Phytophthora idaei]KAG3241148.1 hypothetical protein PI124_g13963 [Phytophthora idaei]
MSTEDDSVGDPTGDWKVDAEEDDVVGVSGEAAQGVASAGAGGARAGEAECAAGDAAATCSRGTSGVQTYRPIREEDSIIAEQYIASLSNNNSLHVAISDHVATSYCSQREVGVFSLFFTSTLKDRERKWTSDVLASDGHTAFPESELNAYLGLEIAMSICPMNEIAEFWPDRRLLSQSAFSETRTGTRFQQIRGALTLHPPEHPTFDKERDPLWRCRGIMEHYQKRFAEFCGANWR